MRTTYTAADVLRLADQGQRYELIDGELVEMSPTGFEHGSIETHVGWVFTNHVRPRRLGPVIVGEVLLYLDQEAGIARAADVAFIRRERLRGRLPLKGAFPDAPDLAVEIISPSNTPEEIRRKVQDWLSHGTLAVLLMYPDPQRVVLWDKNGERVLHGDDELNLDPAPPGFRCQVSDLFPPPDEDDEDSASG